MSRPQKGMIKKQQKGKKRRMARTQQHSPQVWEAFWKKQSIEQVYQNSDRIVRQITAPGDVQGKWIMEIGAGSGRDSFQLVDLGARVILLDYAENSLQLMQQLAQQLDTHVFLIRGDAFHLPFKNNSVDVIFHQGLLEHFTEPRGIVEQSFAALKKGGINVSDVPQKYHLYTAVKHVLIWMNKWFAGWETEFSVGELAALHKRAGFEIYRIYGDWMRPSFLYRAVREMLKKIGIKLPQYPKSIPVLSSCRKSARRFFMKQKFARYTFMDIGVVGKKGNQQ